MSFKLMAAQLMNWMLKEWPEEAELLPFWVTDLARVNSKRPAYVKLSVPDDWVKNIKGNKEGFTDTYIIMRVPRELFQRWTREQRGTALDKAVTIAEDVHGDELGEKHKTLLDNGAAKPTASSSPPEP